MNRAAYTAGLLVKLATMRPIPSAASEFIRGLVSKIRSSELSHHAPLDISFSHHVQPAGYTIRSERPKRLMLKIDRYMAHPMPEPGEINMAPEGGKLAEDSYKAGFASKLAEYGLDQ